MALECETPILKYLGIYKPCTLHPHVKEVFGLFFSLTMKNCLHSLFLFGILRTNVISKQNVSVSLTGNM